MYIDELYRSTKLVKKVTAGGMTDTENDQETESEIPTPNKKYEYQRENSLFNVEEVRNHKEQDYKYYPSFS